MNESGSQILVGVFRDVAWVRVRGKVTYEISSALRSFANCMVAEGQDRIIVDLEECHYMDSTFLGTLAGIALLLKDRPASMFQVINASGDNLESLRDVGLDQVIHVDTEGLSWRHERALVKENVNRPLESPNLDRSAKRQFIAEAHQALCEANRDNISEFRDVLKFLEQQGRC